MIVLEIIKKLTLWSKEQKLEAKRQLRLDMVKLNTKAFKIGINFRLAVTIAILLIISFGAILITSNGLQENQAKTEMLEKAQILARQMNAAWEFIEINQDVIDTDSDGSYNFKGIYCAIAGKSIASRFTHDTEYVIRYTSTTPRKNKSYPDEFESRAYASFSKGSTEYYDVSEYQGNKVFRYVTPLYIEQSCLECHGEPAGEIDKTGNPKEGLRIGDIGGAVSIVMPIENYLEGIHNNILRQAILVFIILLIIVAIIYILVSRLIVKPITKLEEAANQIGVGNLDVSTANISTHGEIRGLARQLDSMTNRLKESYENLESQVATRTEQLKETNEILKKQSVELEQANVRLQNESRYKSDFLTIMSHELRTPLTSILAFTEIWEASVLEKDKGEAEAVREIKENGMLLLQTINNILEAARLSAEKEILALEEIDMVDLFGAVQNSVGFIADKRNITFTTAIERNVPIFMGDWGKLRRIVENLTSNAIKFTQKHGCVGVLAMFDEQLNEVIIEITDTGIGIKAQDLPYIFDRFTQSDRSSYRSYNGSGLGLAVAKELVEVCLGSIEVQSTYHKGSKFTIHIPINLENYLGAKAKEVNGEDHVG